MADHDVVGDALTSGRVPAALSFLTGRWQRDALKRDREIQTLTQAPIKAQTLTQTPIKIPEIKVESTTQDEHKQTEQDPYKHEKPSQRRWFLAAVEKENLVHGYAQRFRALGQFLVYELLCKDKSDSLHLCEALLQAMGVHATSFFRFAFAIRMDGCVNVCYGQESRVTHFEILSYSSYFLVHHSDIHSHTHNPNNRLYLRPHTRRYPSC